MLQLVLDLADVLDHGVQVRLDRTELDLATGLGQCPHQLVEGAEVDGVAGALAGEPRGEQAPGGVRELRVDAQLHELLLEGLAHLLGERLDLGELLLDLLADVLGDVLLQVLRHVLGDVLLQVLRHVLRDVLPEVLDGVLLDLRDGLLEGEGGVVAQQRDDLPQLGRPERLQLVLREVLEVGAGQRLEVGLQVLAEAAAEDPSEGLAETEGEQLQRAGEQAVDRAHLDGLDEGLLLPVVLVALADLDALDDPVHHHAGGDGEELVQEELLEQPDEDLLDQLAGDLVRGEDLRDRAAEGDRQHRDGPGDLGHQLDQLGDDHPLGVLDLVGHLVGEVPQLLGHLPGRGDVVGAAGAADQLVHLGHEGVGRLALEAVLADGDELHQVGTQLGDLAGDHQVVVARGAQLVLVRLRPLHAGHDPEELRQAGRQHDRHGGDSWRW
ncbi:hypothetical protein GCM10018790_47090 [Kitasatospora xanthocidica]|nr:hypothetical protein GCM10018790_47090 [Kitasatospora xanthocidica]